MQVWVHIIGGCTDGQLKKRCKCSFSLVNSHHHDDGRRIVQLSGAEQEIKDTVVEFRRLGWFKTATLAGGNSSAAESSLVMSLR